MTLASLSGSQARYAEAEQLVRRSLAIREKALGPDHPDVAQSLLDLANLHLDQDKFTDVEPLLERALAIYEKAIGPRSPEAADSIRALASCEFKEGKFDDALERSIHCAEIGRELAAKMPENPKPRFLIGSASLLKGRIETAMERSADAQASWRDALSVVEPVARDARGVTAQSTYAQLLLCVGRTDEARPIVKGLLDAGYKDPDLLALCKKSGLLPR
jgi:tetratricopeptide (TPR) repeat protein